jgi:hypothetical protein
MSIASTYLTWLRSVRWHASANHLLEMWVVIAPTYAATRSKRACAAAVIAFYYSRKMTEVRAAASPGNLLAVGNLGWWPWRWPWALQLDFYVPTVAVLLLQLI